MDDAQYSAFNLAEVLTDYQNDPSQLVAEKYADEIDTVHIHNVLNDLTDKLTVSPESINDEKCFDSAMYLL